MNLQILSIYDSKAETWMEPFYAPNNAVGERIFATACQNQDGNLAKHPGDFTLYNVGQWNPEKGELNAKIATQIGPATKYVKGDQE